MQQKSPRVGLALPAGLLRDTLAAALERHGHHVVGACLPHPRALGPLLAAGPDVLLLAADDEADETVDPVHPVEDVEAVEVSRVEVSRVEGCLRRAAHADVPVVVITGGRTGEALRERRADGLAGEAVHVGRHEPLSTLLGLLEAAAGSTPAPARPQLVSVPPARPALSAQEERTLVLYVSGLKLVAVARRLGVRYDTAKGYLDRVRVKYAAVGRPARTKTELYRVALQDGLLRHDVDRRDVGRGEGSGDDVDGDAGGSRRRAEPRDGSPPDPADPADPADDVGRPSGWGPRGPAEAMLRAEVRGRATGR